MAADTSPRTGTCPPRREARLARVPRGRVAAGSARPSAGHAGLGRLWPVALAIVIVLAYGS